MKEIISTNGKVIQVSDEDFDFINQWKWYARKAKKTFYATRHNSSNKVYMHKVIMNTPEGYLTDHIDRNGLNNQRNNLRIVTVAQSNCNKAGCRNTSSKYKGVTFRKACKNKWEAQIGINGKVISLGRFATELDAAKEYNNAALKYHKEFAYLNAL